MQQENEKSFVWAFGGERIILKGREICYLHTQQRKVFLHTFRRVYRVGGSFKEAVEKLTGLPMVRTHNAYLVHLDYLEAVNGERAVLKNGDSVPVSRHYWKQVREAVEQYYAAGGGLKYGRIPAQNRRESDVLSNPPCA